MCVYSCGGTNAGFFIRWCVNLLYFFAHSGWIVNPLDSTNGMNLESERKHDGHSRKLSSVVSVLSSPQWNTRTSKQALDMSNDAGSSARVPGGSVIGSHFITLPQHSHVTGSRDIVCVSMMVHPSNG